MYSLCVPVQPTPRGAQFGEIDIDSELVTVKEDLDGGEEQIMMLNNGCLCCTVRDDLVKMLNTLVRTLLPSCEPLADSPQLTLPLPLMLKSMTTPHLVFLFPLQYERRDKFDQVVIETTGLANPGPIIQTFFLDPSIANTMKLDGVVTLVDAKHAELHLDEVKPDGVVNEAVEQIAYADRIILNKTDLVSPEDVRRLEDRIRGINSLAQVRQAQRANVPVEYVMGVGGFDLEKVQQEVRFLFVFK
jgi:G3E family GTPase